MSKLSEAVKRWRKRHPEAAKAAMAADHRKRYLQRYTDPSSPDFDPARAARLIALRKKRDGAKR